MSGFSQDTDGDGITDSFDHFPNDRMYDSYTDVIAAPSGSGTQLDPYLISKLADLYWVTQNDTSWTSYFKQTADIDATNSKLWNGGYGFERIGEGPSNHFKGRYDGNYHTISNIYQLGTYGNQAGMFGAILDGAVRNLKLTAPIIVVTEFTQYGGILAGQVLNSIVKTEATIQNVVIESATITGTSIADNAYYGGMVGISQNALFKDCKATLLDLNLSVSNTNVSVGGFIGTSDQNDKLLNCSVDGILTSDSRFFGGLIGNSSIVSADDYSQILNCYSNVSLYSNNADFVGGLIGVATNVSINNSYSKNTISFNTDEIQIGGFIGNLDYLFNTVPTDFNYITNNYIATTFTGTTTNQSGIGLFLGEDSADSYGANNFYQELAGYGAIGISRNSSLVSNTVSVTDTEIKTETTFTNWDFIDTWGIDSSTNGGYPYLKNIENYYFEIPTIAIPDQLTGFEGSQLGPSNPLSFTLSATNVTYDMELIASDNFEISTEGTYTNTLTIQPTNGLVNETIYVRLNNTNYGTYSGTLDITSLKSSNSINLNGIVVEYPVITGPSEVGLGDQIRLDASLDPAPSNTWSATSNGYITGYGTYAYSIGTNLGTYTVTYRDVNSRTAEKLITVVQGTTATPTLELIGDTSEISSLTISYTLGENLLADSTKLTFTPVGGGSSIVWTMGNYFSKEFSYTIGTTPSDSPYIRSDTAALNYNSTYSLTLSYQDYYGNPIASSSAVSFTTLSIPLTSISSTTYYSLKNKPLNPIEVTNSGGAASFSISPTLPEGLTIDSTTGTVSGTPTVSQLSTTYKITAQNLAGTDSLTFELFVDEPPQIHTSVISYTENQSTGALLGVVSVTDNIAVQSIEISSGNDIGYFAIDSSTGSLTMTSSGTISMVNDYESGSATTTLEITVTDTYSNTSTSQLDVVVYDLDEIPPVIHTESITYYQSDFYGELIGTISATDNIGVVSYSIVGSSPYFELQERSLLMQTTETAFTSEANDISLGSNTFSLTIQVTDARSNTSTKTIDLYLRSRPVTYNVTATAKENTAQNIQLNATDEDGDNLIYSLVSTPTHGSVTISGSIAIYFSEDDYSTTDSFTYQVFDGFGFSNPSDVTIDIIPVNDPPVLLNLDYTVIEQVEYTSTDIKVYDPDTPTTNLVYSIVSSPTYGSATISGSQFIYTSNSDTATSDVFLLKVSDGELSDTKSVTLTITAVNDPPIPTNIATITYGLVTTTLNLTATDPENDKLTYELYNVPNHGVASVSGTTAYYHPIEGPTGTYSFSYRVIDDKLGISTGTISITVANHDPSTKGYVLEVKPSSTTTFTLSGTDQDQDDATLNFEIKDLPTRGSLTSSGTLATYELAISEVGTYTATYSVRDNLGGEDIGTISITVVNVPPITKVHSITVVEQVTTTIELSGVDHNNDPMSYSMVVTPTYGTATISGSLLTYTSTSDSETKDSLVYIINDGTSNSDSATLSITILPLNDPPEIPPFNLSAVENVLSEMEVYVYDPDSKTSSISISLVSSPTFGTAALSGTTLYYTSNSDTAVEDSFSIKAFDGEIYSDVSTVTIFIGPVNDPPILGNFSIEAREQEEFVSDDIGAIDLDSPNNSLTYSIESLPKNGSATISGSQFIYTSNSDTATSDEFSIKASDGELFSSAASITVKILPVNDDPIVTNISTTTYGLVTTTLTLKATDPEEKELVYVLEALPLHGIATVSGTSAYYYPQIGYSGTYSFTYRVLDGVGGYGIGTISVTVANHLPVVSSTSATIDPTGTVTFSLTATDEDQDDETLIFELENLPSSGSLNINGAIATYQTINAPGGVYSATFRVIDNLGGTVTGTINLIVQNNPPLTNVVSVTALEQIKSTIQLLGEDLENDQLVYSLISSPTYGTATISGSTLLYTSFDEIENNLYETLSYQAYDGSNYSNVSSITITIRPFDDPPILYSFNMNALEQTSSQSEGIYVYDPDSIDHSFIIVDQPSYGSATISSSVILYESNSDIATSDQLSIKAFDGNSFSNVVTVSVSILGVNDKPSASNITISTDEDTSNEIMLLGIDPDGDLLTYTIVTQPKNGSLVLESDKATYTPNMNYYGEDSFRYKASDGTEETQVATVTISVISVNDAPVLSSTTLMVTANVSETLNLEGSDVEGDSLTYSIASNPTHGTASIEGSILTYTPELDYTGSDVLTVKANDGSSDSAPATISITVFLATDGDGDGILDHLDNCPTTSNVDQADGDGDGIGDVCDTNYNPSIRSSSFSIMENASNETLIGTIEIVDTDVSDTHTFSIVENDYVSIDSSTGFLSVKETSLYDYEKTKEFTISVSVSDGTNTATKELTITIDNENEAPGLLTSRSASVNEMATTGTVIKTLSAIDPESDAITYSITEGNPDNIFKIEENRLILASTLDYEIIPLHSLTIKASDGTLESLSSFNVEVIDVPNTSSTESVTITVYDVMVEDNTSRVDYSSMTASGETGLLFEIIGGADAALFTIDPNSGGLIFNTPPDYESPSDADSNNSYDLVIKVTYLNDGSSLIPVVTSSTNFAVPEANALAEDQTEVILVSATQDSDSDGVVDVSDNCPTTYNPNQADWDGDGIGDVCDDSDQDGIADYQDSCVSSVFGATVDLTGCAVFSLPYNNFNVEVTSATCVGTSNGIISIAAHASTYTYTVSISGQSSTTLSSANNYANQISGLEAGTYQVCLGVEGQSGYQQCYTVVIGEPNALSARSSVNYTGRTVDLSLDGSKEYHIKVNGKTFTTSSSELSLDLKAGMNTIEVYTDLTCQGSFFQEVFVSEEVLAYPNPTTDWVQLYVGGVDQTVQLILSDVSGYQYDLRELKIPTNRVIEYNLSDYQTGVYFFRLSGETIQSNLKVIKD